MDLVKQLRAGSQGVQLSNPWYAEPRAAERFEVEGTAVFPRATGQRWSGVQPSTKIGGQRILKWLGQ